MVTYAHYRIACTLSKSLPRRLSYSLAVAVADGFYLADKTGRAAVRSNLRTVFGANGSVLTPEELAHQARQTFRFFGKYLVDFFRFSRISDAEASRLLQIEKEEYALQALAMDRGVLGISAHLGNWELGAFAVRRWGKRLYAVVLPQRMEKVNRLFQEHRAGRGINVLPLGNAVGEILACLKRKEIVGLLADKDFTRHDRRVNFFGKPVRLPRGPAFLAVKTGAPILPGFVVRQPDDSFLLRYYPPITADRGQDRDEIQQAICRVLESVISEYPCQWFMFAHFWDDCAEAGVTNCNPSALQFSRSQHGTDRTSDG